MKTYTFSNNYNTHSFEAATYDEALDALIAVCGSEMYASHFIFIGCE